MTSTVRLLIPGLLLPVVDVGTSAFRKNRFTLLGTLRRKPGEILFRCSFCKGNVP